MKVGVCELDPALEAGSDAWEALCYRVRREKPDLFLLNEMPFGPWLARAPEFDRHLWETSVRIHETAVARLSELGAPFIGGSRPREIAGTRVNEAFVWSEASGVQPIHTKQFFPNEEGYFESRWFSPGEQRFGITDKDRDGFAAGFLLCTDVMFNEHARAYGRRGAQLILVPRAVGTHSLPRWLVAMKMAAIVSGAYVLTSNRAGSNAQGQVFGGRGWVIDPDGEMVAQTSEDTSVVFHELDLDGVTRAQQHYPCYVEDVLNPSRQTVERKR